MDSGLQIFKHGDFTARTITDDNGEIWFVAKDVAQVLGYPEASIKQMANLIRPVPDLWKGLKRIMTPGGEQEMTCLSEQGLYFFLGRSDKKAALPYQMWVAGEVVPSIRKHGFYATPQTAEQIIADPDTFIKVLTALKEEKTKVAALTAKVEEGRPKVIFADAVSASEDCILIGNFAKLLGQNGINIGQTRLFAWFRENGWLMNTWDGRRNTPTQKAINSGFFKTKENVNYVNGELRIFSPTPLLTGKGQRFFMDGFLSGRFHL